MFSISDAEIRLAHFPGDTPVTCAISTNTSARTACLLLEGTGVSGVNRVRCSCSARSSTPELPSPFFPAGSFHNYQIKTCMITNSTFQ